MKNGMTKAERLKAFKEAKALKRALQERLATLADFLVESETKITVTDIVKYTHHDVLVHSKKYRREEYETILKDLYCGEIKLFKDAAGSFSFDVRDFFYTTERYYPCIYSRVVPWFIQELRHEGLIRFEFVEYEDNLPLCESATFVVVKN